VALNGYKFVDLQQNQLEEIQKTENNINKNNNDEIILLAFKRQ
jgi:hypothetical protein